MPQATSLTDKEDTFSKKSLNSIQGYECTRMIERIANEFQIPIQGQQCPIRPGLIIFRQVTKMLKFFTKQRGIYGANICFLNGMTLQIMTLYVMELIYT